VGRQQQNRFLPPIVRQISPPPKKRSPIADDDGTAIAKKGAHPNAEGGERRYMSAMERQAEGISEVLWTKKHSKPVSIDMKAGAVFRHWGVTSVCTDQSHYHRSVTFGTGNQMIFISMDSLTSLNSVHLN
jgi:hypothetical protein